MDAVQLHWLSVPRRNSVDRWDYEEPKYVDTAVYLAQLQKRGIVRNVALTNFNTSAMRQIVDAGVNVLSNQVTLCRRPVTRQVQYSLLDRRPENALLSFCKDSGVRLLCYGTVAGIHATSVSSPCEAAGSLTNIWERPSLESGACTATSSTALVVGRSCKSFCKC